MGWYFFGHFFLPFPLKRKKYFSIFESLMHRKKKLCMWIFNIRMSRSWNWNFAWYYKSILQANIRSWAPGFEADVLLFVLHDISLILDFNLSFFFCRAHLKSIRPLQRFSPCKSWINLTIVLLYNCYKYYCFSYGYVVRYENTYFFPDIVH